ncbi:NUDIX domain-containing protein [Micromonospora sp. NPDC047707]|uniref:NUDIX domain-containing protein n=1 Tax=Micromonospora sp. NPDC047707 TaxID=3154498 RepID=UPI0034523CFA
MRVVREIRALVETLTPVDELEARHRAECLAWLAGTEDIFRREKPRTPSPHLVAYFLLYGETDGSVLLVDHRKAGMWLPSGGHVEPGEHPTKTVRREVIEERACRPCSLRPSASARLPHRHRNGRGATGPAHRREPLVRIEGVRGSNPLSSTQLKGRFRSSETAFFDLVQQSSTAAHRNCSPSRVRAVSVASEATWA